MTPPERERKKIDWRGWITLAWVLWFGWLYTLMVLQQRGSGLRKAIATVGAMLTRLF